MAVFKGPHPETGEPLEVSEEYAPNFPPQDLPSQEEVFAIDYAPEDIAEIAQRLRKEAGLPDKPEAETADLSTDGSGIIDKVKDTLN